ncbi:DUF2514 family protein [Variovorax sp. J22R133]|uniref:DUF2514 family protein n=1 Tax=Variovorax brevis TaxID=3053503 RepID=UPI0025749634|nr:DUF2514 family protein [Variovorax sp. J22R133]MDM0116940.1 DUF2514 family protein [Variovorax sp. J22R133]
MRRTDLQRKALDEAATQVQVAQRDAAGARDSHELVQQQAARYAAAARAASARAAALESSAAGVDPIGVFAELLGRADARTGKLAEIADRARVAGLLCERSYDALISPE